MAALSALVLHAGVAASTVDSLQLQPAAACWANASSKYMNVAGSDGPFFEAATEAACAAACCGNSSTCCGYTYALTQPTGNAHCALGGRCCWLKRGSSCHLVAGNCRAGNCSSALNARYAPPPPPRPSPYHTPRLAHVRTIASDPAGNLRDPSAVVQDPKTKRWHFWVGMMILPGSVFVFVWIP